MSKLIVLFYYFIFVSAIFGSITKSGFLLLGGNDDDDYNYLDTVEAYGSDLSLPPLPHLPFNLSNPIAEMMESGAIYLAGGFANGFTKNDTTFFLSSLSSFKWEEVEARMPKHVDFASSVVVGNIILVLGSYSPDLTDYIQMLDTNKSPPTWKLLNKTLHCSAHWCGVLPEPLEFHSAAVYEGQVIIVKRTGVTYTTSVSSIINDTELDWVKGELPGVEYPAKGPGLEVCEGKLVAVIGRQVFTKATMDSQWVQLKPLPEEKSYYPSIGSVGGNIVIAGGGEEVRGDEGAIGSATVFMWVEASSEWEEVTSLKIPRNSHATVQLPGGDYNYYTRNVTYNYNKQNTISQ